MRTATMSVWPLVVAFTHVFAHDYAHGRAEQSVMPKLRKGEEWAVLLRKQIKGEVGQGFSVCGHFRTEGVHSGITKLTFRNEAGQRSSVMLPFEWKKSSSRLILNRVAAIADVIRDHPQTDLKDAAVTNADTLDNPVAKKEAEVTGWDVVRQKFLASKAGLRPSTLKDWTLRVDRTMAVLDSKPKPRTGTAVMERFKELFFIGPNGEEAGPHAQMEAGSKGRRRNLKDASSFLLYGVERCAMPDRYRPPSASIIEELVGKTTISAEERQTPALKPEQFTTLLDDLIKLDDNYPLMLATAVCGYVGCRPSELATLVVRDGVAKVTSTKRNARTMNRQPPTRVVAPLEIDGRNFEGRRLLLAIEAGGEMGRFPKALRYQIDRVMDKNHPNHTTSFRDVGSCFNQMLCRSKAWKKLMADAANRNLSPYSLRHGFSWRCTFGETRMAMRAAARLMGHDLGTHQRWYASWIDGESVMEEVDRYNAKVAS